MNQRIVKLIMFGICIVSLLSLSYFWLRPSNYVNAVACENNLFSQCLEKEIEYSNSLENKHYVTALSLLEGENVFSSKVIDYESNFTNRLLTVSVRYERPVFFITNNGSYDYYSDTGEIIFSSDELIESIPQLTTTYEFEDDLERQLLLIKLAEFVAGVQVIDVPLTTIRVEQPHQILLTSDELDDKIIVASMLDRITEQVASLQLILKAVKLEKSFTYVELRSAQPFLTNNLP